MVAERPRARHLVGVEADARLEPGALAVDEREAGHRHPAEARREVDDAVEDRLRRHVEDPARAEGEQPLLLEGGPQRPAGRGVGGCGQSEQVPLQEVAAEQPERPALLLGLHPLRDDGQAELGREADDRADDGRVAGALGHPGHEHPVDLQGLHREPVELGEAGEARPEVVEGGVAAEGPQALEPLPGAGRVVGDRRLGHLEPQRLGRQAGGVEHRRHVVDQLRVGELVGRDVDRELEGGEEVGPPLGHLGAGDLEHLAG